MRIKTVMALFLLATVCLPAMAQTGDANGDGSVSVADIFYLDNFLLAGGPPPLNPCDNNTDAVVDGADVFYLINHLFAGGPPPGGTSLIGSSSGQDKVTVGSVTATSTTITVPVYVRDTSGTYLGVDQASGRRIAGLMLQVHYSPASQVSSVSVAKAGVTELGTEIFSTTHSAAGSKTLVILFNESSNPLAFTSNAADPGQLVANLTFTLSGALTAPIAVTLDSANTLLSNQAGTLKETSGNGALTLEDGSISPQLTGYTLTPASQSIAVGSSGVVTVGMPSAQATNTLVNLSSSNTSVATVLASVTIPAGQTTANALVSGISIGGPVTLTATFPAGLGGATPTAAVTVVAESVSMSPGSQNVLAGGSGTVTLNIGSQHPSPVTVTLTSSNTGVATVPSTVTIPSNNTSIDFSVTGVATNGGPVTITATLPGSLGGATTTTSVTVVPPSISLSLSPESQTVAVGNNATITATITPAQPVDTVLTLSSSNGSIASIPSTATILAGATSVTFAANGVARGGPVTITATFSGGSASAQVTVAGVPGDANGDGRVSVADVFYLINFLFAGGPPPL